MPSLGLASSFSLSWTSLIMQHAFAQTCLTDVHRLSLRFPTACQQSAVIFRGRLYYGCTLRFSWRWLRQNNRANNFVTSFHCSGGSDSYCVPLWSRRKYLNSEQKSFCKASGMFMVVRGSSGATLVILDFISSDATLRCDRLCTYVLQDL